MIICFRKIALKANPRFIFWEYVGDSASSTKMLKIWSVICATGKRARFDPFHGILDWCGKKTFLGS